MGVNTGLLIWTVAAAFGVAAIVRESALAFTAVKLIGALYLIWLGLQALRSAARHSAHELRDEADLLHGPDEPSLLGARPAATRAGSRADTNCGSKAVKNAPILGLARSLNRPCRNPSRAPPRVLAPTSSSPPSPARPTSRPRPRPRPRRRRASPRTADTGPLHDYEYDATWLAAPRTSLSAERSAAAGSGAGSQWSPQQPDQAFDNE